MVGQRRLCSLEMPLVARAVWLSSQQAVLDDGVLYPGLGWVLLAVCRSSLVMRRRTNSPHFVSRSFHMVGCGRTSTLHFGFSGHQYADARVGTYFL
jgi:hypothetical protein